MTKIQAMWLVYESNLTKYEKLLLLDFIYTEPKELIPFIIDEFKLSDFSKAAKKARELGKKISKKASDIYYRSGVKLSHHPVWSRLSQYPPAIIDPTPSAAFRYPVVRSDVEKGIKFVRSKFLRAKT